MWTLGTLCVALALGAAPTRADDTAKPAFELQDFGRVIEAPIVLIVQSPGMARSSVRRLSEAIEARELDAWNLRFRTDASWPETGAALYAAETVLPDAVRELRRRRSGPLALAGEGLGGTLALVSASIALPDAVALLGAPLEATPSELVRWLGGQELPPIVVDPPLQARWRSLRALPLLLGEPLPALEPLPTALARDLLRWLEQGPPLDPLKVSCPVLATAGAGDRFAPPESVRAVADRLPKGEFVRFGMLRLDIEDPDHAALLRKGPYLRTLSRWLDRTLRRAPRATPP